MLRTGTARARFAELVDAATGRDSSASDATDALFARLATALRSHDLGDDSAYLAEELVRLPWSLGDRQRRALAFVVLATFISARQGSTRLPLSGGVRGPFGRLVRALCDAGELDFPIATTVRDAVKLASDVTIDHLFGHPGEYRPLIVDDGHVYLHRLYRCEHSLAERISQRLDSPPEATEAAIADGLADVVARPAVRSGTDVKLSDEQRSAVECALSHRLSVVTGGPGTGKTAVIASIVRTAARLDIAPPQIVLAAPTGKAAQRMGDSVLGTLGTVAAPAEVDTRLASALPAPQTLHRLLGYVPSTNRFRHHENHPLRADIIIIDEASMVDLELMERLLRAAPLSARLVLIGDADQLPSVSAGAVLRDLLDVDRELSHGFCARLTRSYRMDASDSAGARILEAATDINAGSPRVAASEGLIVDSPAREYAREWHRSRILDADGFREAATRTYEYGDDGIDVRDAPGLERLLSIHQKSKLLAVTRRHVDGSNAINRLLHDYAVAEVSGARAPDFCPGEPVIVRRNDYRRELFNGDQGVIVEARAAEAPQPQSSRSSRSQLHALFPRPSAPGGYALFPVDSLRSNLDHAYVLTVHQSQGSEFDEVALLFPPIDVPLITRELIYTGLTRARKNAVLVAHPELVRSGAKRTVHRFSGLCDRLRQLRAQR